MCMWHSTTNIFRLLFQCNLAIQIFKRWIITWKCAVATQLVIRGMENVYTCPLFIHAHTKYIYYIEINIEYV